MGPLLTEPFLSVALSSPSANFDEVERRACRGEIFRPNKCHSSKHKLHFVGTTIIDERDKHGFVCRQFLAVELDCEHACANAQRIFHGYLVSRGTVSIGDFESGPAIRDAGGKQQISPLDAKPQ